MLAPSAGGMGVPSPVLRRHEARLERPPSRPHSCCLRRSHIAFNPHFFPCNDAH